MGLDLFHRGLPADADLFRLAPGAEEFFVRARVPLMLFGAKAMPEVVRRDPRASPLRGLFETSPEIDGWHVAPHIPRPPAFARELHDAAGAGSGGELTESSLAYQFVYGARWRQPPEAFAPSGVSPPAKVRELSAFAHSVDRARLPEEDREVFVVLANFYDRMAALGHVEVFFFMS